MYNFIRPYKASAVFQYYNVYEEFKLLLLSRPWPWGVCVKFLLKNLMVHLSILNLQCLPSFMVNSSNRSQPTSSCSSTFSFLLSSQYFRYLSLVEPSIDVMVHLSILYLQCLPSFMVNSSNRSQPTSSCSSTFSFLL